MRRRVRQSVHDSANKMYEQKIKEYLSKYGFGAFAPKAVLFDMDGVLFNSMPYHAACWSRVSKEYGLPMSEEEVYMHEGRTAESTINILTMREWGRPATEAEIRQLYAEKCKSFNECPEAEKISGADEVLAKVKGSGLRVAVVTGSGQQSLLQRLTENYPGCFTKELIVSGDDVREGKPSPEPYLMGLEKLGVQPWEALVVENAPLGVRAAVAAKIFTVAVNTGPLPDRALLDEGANLLFPDMHAFAEQWDKLSSHF